ncbi:SIMPL domain-containing protein [Desertivirga arenae]|uniref:SIMPL domain-containing protein n=1 Tax=Desertivirga arenae TaxID=2810309 RepID=UPI001A97BD6C|nr:SIMPL domain-containing protein [Pedobacter sp. SYSU D00823]
MRKLHAITGLLLMMSSAAFSQNKSFIDQPYVEVNGYADTLITPNEIYIKINISEKDTKDKVSIEELESKMVNGLKAIGIKTETELSTSDMISNYKFYLLKQKDVVKSKEYLLKVSDAPTASKVFIALEDMGISNTSISKVDHTDLENLQNICRARAVENAKVRAKALTKPLNQTVGSAIQILEINPGFNQPLQGRIYGVAVSGYATKQKYEAPKIEFEKIKIESTINVKFILK